MHRILLIDDEPKIIEDMLSIYGYEVDVATDGLTGLQTVYNTEKPYDLLILDVQMPKMDGWAVLKSIREGSECPDIPIIMLTCMDNEELLVSGLRRGADQYLTKPITPKRLFAHIEAIARLSRRGAKHQSNEDKSAKAALEVLTQREAEILQYIVQGFSNQAIGEKLVISETTVKNHLAHIYKKLNVSNRTQAAFLAQKLKLI